MSTDLRERLARIGLDRDALAPYRGRVVSRVSRVSACMLSPFAVMHAANGRWLLAAITLLACTMLVLTTFDLRRGRRPAVAVTFGLVGLSAVTAGAIILNGVNALLWAYPVLIAGYFVVPRLRAHALSVFHLLVTSAATSASLGPGVGLRVAATMILILVMLNLVINFVGELQNTLEVQAITDPLTGAFNRRHFDQHLSFLAVQAHVHQDALVAIDIDHFKSINDLHGHAAGDQVLRGMVETVQAHTRVTDLLFRTGGEEFMLLLRAVTPEQALRLAEGLRATLAQAPLLPGRPVTVSMGVSLRPSGEPVDRWLKRSDEALYTAKHSGRNCVVLAPAAAEPPA
jgi:diguanylate cyclase (GGDEF)-like protein